MGARGKGIFTLILAVVEDSVSTSFSFLLQILNCRIQASLQFLLNPAFRLVGKKMTFSASIRHVTGYAH